MDYFIGIDGGGTKTRGFLASLEGDVLCDVVIGPSNHQLVGKENTRQALQVLFKKLIATLPEKHATDVRGAYLGLSGADQPSDFSLLESLVSDIFYDVPYTLDNDSWCVLRSGLHQQWGAASIYGTGSNACCAGKDGQHHILRALHFPLGGYGGGLEMAQEALHFAFRADEETYRATQLTVELPKLFGVATMTALLELMYPVSHLDEADYKKIPPVVFSLAAEGDVVCIEILEKMGRIQGEMTRAIIAKAGLDGEETPVVLGGSVYKGKAPHFIEAMMHTIQETVPKAYAVHPELPPVAGAWMLAVENSGFLVMPEVYDRLKKHFETSPHL